MLARYFNSWLNWLPKEIISIDSPLPLNFGKLTQNSQNLKISSCATPPTARCFPFVASRFAENDLKKTRPFGSNISHHHAVKGTKKFKS